MERTRKIWIGEGSMRELAANPEIWDPMSRTCIGMLTGIESEKIGGNGRKKYEGAFLVQRNGAIVLDSVIIGHPSQTKEATIEMLESLRNGNRTCAFHMLTPYPGTKEYRTFTEQKKILDYDLSRYDRRHVIVRNEIGVKGTLELYTQACKKAQTILGTIKEIVRIIKDSTNITIAFWRGIILSMARSRNLLIGANMWKISGEKEKFECVPIEPAGDQSAAHSSLSTAHGQ